MTEADEGWRRCVVAIMEGWTKRSMAGKLLNKNLHEGVQIWDGGLSGCIICSAESEASLERRIYMKGLLRQERSY